MRRLLFPHQNKPLEVSLRVTWSQQNVLLLVIWSSRKGKCVEGASNKASITSVRGQSSACLLQSDKASTLLTFVGPHYNSYLARNRRDRDSYGKISIHFVSEVIQALCTLPALTQLSQLSFDHLAWLVLRESGISFGMFTAFVLIECFLFEL